MAKLKKTTFDKIVTAAEDFVNEQKGKWGEDEWLDLLTILKQLGIDLSDEMQAYVRQLLEAMRSVYQATGSTQGMTSALTSATKESVEFVKVHKAIWGYSDWEDFADHVKENTRVFSKETSSYLNEILDSLKVLLGKNAKATSSAPAKAAPKAPAAPSKVVAPKQPQVASSQAAPQKAPAPPKKATTKPAPAPAPAKAPKPPKKEPKTKTSAAKPAASKAAASKAAASATPDDLTAISGVGPALQKKLIDHGITQYAQIAELTAGDIAHLEAEVIKFSGRIQRDGWIEQAKALMKK